MSASKNIYLLWDFAAGVYLSEAPSPPMTPYPPSYTLYTCIVYCILVTYSHGGGGGGVQKTKKDRRAPTKKKKGGKKKNKNK
jgi:hypothetical protein